MYQHNEGKYCMYYGHKFCRHLVGKFCNVSYKIYLNLPRWNVSQARPVPCGVHGQLDQRGRNGGPATLPDERCHIGHSGKLSDFRFCVVSEWYRFYVDFQCKN